jgi:hypothetical protein
MNPSSLATLKPFSSAQQARIRGNIARSYTFFGNRNAGSLASATKQANALWNTAKRFYGGKQPRLDINQLPGRVLGSAFLGSKGINVSSNLASVASGTNPNARRVLANVLLHEWTHARQPLGHGRGTGQTTPLIEGGADAYAHYVADALKIKHDPGYAHYINFVNKHLGQNWIRHGQFMGP